MMQKNAEAWRAELARAVSAAGPQQRHAQLDLGGCEQQFVEALQDASRRAAMAYVRDLMDLARDYFDCRFGAGTPEAQAGLNDFGSIVLGCATENLGLLFRQDWGGFLTAVSGCVINKLITGDGDGDGGGTQTGFDPDPSKRDCG